MKDCLKATSPPFAIPIALALALGMAGISLAPDRSSFNQTRMLELGMLAYLTVLLLLPAIKKAGMPLSIRFSSFSLLAMLGLLGLVSTLLTRWPMYALLDIGHYILLGTASIAAAALFKANRSAARWLVMGLSVGATIAVFRLFTQIGLTAITGIGTPLLEWSAPYSNPRFIAQAVIWALPLLVVMPAIMGKDDARPWQRLSTVLCASLWTLLIWSGSRGAILGLGLALFLVWFFSSNEVRTRLIRPLILNGVLGILAWTASMFMVGWDFTNRRLGLSLTRFDASGRELLIQKSLVLMREHPLLGIGPAQFPAYNFQADSLHYESHPHNFLLQIAVEWGIPAALIFLVLAYRFLKVMIRNVRGSNDLVAHALLISLIAATALSLIDGPQIMPLHLLCAVPCIGLLISRTTTSPSPLSSHQHTRFIILTATMLLAWAMMIPGLVSNPGCLTYPVTAERQLPNGIGYDNPRFWAQGRIPVDPATCLEQGRYINGEDRFYGPPPPRTTFP